METRRKRDPAAMAAIAQLNESIELCERAAVRLAEGMSLATAAKRKIVRLRRRLQQLGGHDQVEG